MKASSLDDTTSQNASIAVSSKLCIQRTSKLQSESSAPQTILGKIQLSPVLSHNTETGQKKMVQLAYPGLDHYPMFFRAL